MHSKQGGKRCSIRWQAEEEFNIRKWDGYNIL